MSAWLPVAAWCAAIFAASAMPADGLPAGRLWQLDKLVHAAIYGVLAALVWRAARARIPGVSPARAAAIAIAAAALYAVTDELHQRYVPGRSPSLGDLVADAIGSAAACAALVHLRSRRGARARRSSPPQER